MTDLAPDVVGGLEAAQQSGKTGRRPGGSFRRWTERRWVLPAAEAVVSVAAGVGFMLLCMHISANPFSRVGQVSGLAKVQQYAAMIGLPILAVLLYSAYRGSVQRREIVQRLVCAAVAGLATGIVAGGIAVALHGTPWGLGGQEGDPGNLQGMANDMMRGKGLPGVYPPGFPAVLAAWAELRYNGIAGVGYALKDLQLLLSALVGPMSYLAWRLMLRPFWALAIAVPSAVLFLDPIRPYSHVVMIILIPLLAACFRDLRRVAERSLRSALLRGIGFGVVFGALFLWYSGWYVWSAPGVLVMGLALFPWRRGFQAIKRALVYLASIVVSAAVVGAPLLYQLARYGEDTTDRYAYISTYIDPAYVLGWMSDRTGNFTYKNWPDTGELAGQSGFAVLLIVGFGLGIGLGLKNMVVRTTAMTLASAWLLRFWFASHMAHDQAVQLYPRTTWIIMYSLMILAVYGLMLLVQRGSGWLGGALKSAGATSVLPSRKAMAQVTAGLICAVALFTAMGASWNANRYMPDPSTNSMGIDAWRSHTLVKENGTCSKFTPVPGGGCGAVNMELAQPPRTDPSFRLWCANTVDDKDYLAVCGRKAPW
jgi:galactan 5-O-arabinofuranosyltransferase